MDNNTSKVILCEPKRYAKLVDMELTSEYITELLGGDYEVSYDLESDICFVYRKDAKALGLLPNRAIREPDLLKEMTYTELREAFNNHEQVYPDDHLTGYILFSQDSFTAPYSEASRTYVVSSNNKAFIPGMGGYSIYGSSLDGSDLCVRLDRYMAIEHGGADGWKIEKCYLIESGKEISAVTHGPMIICSCDENEQLRGLSESDMYHYHDAYWFPEKIREENGKIVAEPFRPERRDYER